MLRKDFSFVYDKRGIKWFLSRRVERLDLNFKKIEGWLDGVKLELENS